MPAHQATGTSSQPSPSSPLQASELIKTESPTQPQNGFGSPNFGGSAPVGGASDWRTSRTGELGPASEGGGAAEFSGRLDEVLPSAEAQNMDIGGKFARMTYPKSRFEVGAGCVGGG